MPYKERSSGAPGEHMSRIYSSIVLFGVREQVNFPDADERRGVVYEAKHPVLQRAVESGLDWDCRDMTGYPAYEDGDVLLFVGRRLSLVDVDAPCGGFSEEDVAGAVGDARERLAGAGFAGAPQFHHVADHCD